MADRASLSFFLAVAFTAVPCLSSLPCRGDANGSSPRMPPVKPWPEADRLFRSHPKWRGGDSAYSVSLGGERVLWLFGDSFVGGRPGGTRKGCRMVRNSIAVQEGLDPSKASIEFYWGS